MGRGRHAREVRSQDFYDVHHVYWPRSLYRGSPATQFRNLACHKVRMHRRDHNDLHHQDSPPKKPSTAFMAEIVRQHVKERLCYLGACFGGETSETCNLRMPEMRSKV